MKKHILFYVSICCLSLSAQYNFSNISFSQYQRKNELSGSYEINNEAAQIQSDALRTYKNLRLYFLKGNHAIRDASRNLGNYLTLSDALKKGFLSVTELEGGSVNTLMFQNLGKDTILVLAGEVVMGGKQDRVVANDLLLGPNSGKVPVSVFCVEHGRWSANGSGTQFQGYYGFSNASVRKQAVVDKSQGAVWENVAKTNAKGKVNPGTGALTALRNADSLNADILGYMNFFKPMLESDTDVIGFVAVTGDTIISCDLFANHALYKTHAEGLVKAAALEASTNGKPVTIAATAVLAFLAEFLADESKQETALNEKGTLLKSKGAKVHMNYYKTGKSANSEMVPDNLPIRPYIPNRR